MKTLILRVTASLFIFCCGATSFAIDQVVLKNGDILEGKVLSEVPNRHVDFQLINGQKKRYPLSEVASVDRDVPSNRDGDMMGVDRRIFLAPMAGLLLAPSTGDAVFTFGAKFGVNTANLGGSFFAPALSYRLYTATEGFTSASLHFIDLQFLFRRIGQSGFYIGPEAGVLVVDARLGNLSGTGAVFSLGANLGYEIQLSDSFALGPDVNFNYIPEASGSLLSFMLAATFQFE